MLSKYSVRKPFTVVVAIIIVLILGVVSYTNMSIDLLPNMNFPYVVIVTTYPGAAAEEVEDKVTIPVETAMSSVTDVDNITSTSSDNYSMVAMEFQQSADMDSAIVEVNSLLDQLEDALPEGVGSPLSMRINPSMIPTMIFAVSLEGQDRQAVSDLVDTALTSEFESLGGVSSVSATGLLENMIHVTISEEKIDALQKQLDENIQTTIDEAVEAGNEQFTNMQNEVISMTEGAYKKQAEAEMAKAAITTATTNVLIEQVREGLMAKMQAYADDVQKVLEDYQKGIQEQIQQRISQITDRLSPEEPGEEVPTEDETPAAILPEDLTPEEMEQRLEELQEQIDRLTQVIADMESQEDLGPVMDRIREALKNAISSRLPQIPALDLDNMMTEIMAEAQASVANSPEVKQATEKYAALYAESIAQSEAADTAKTNLQIAAAMAAAQSESADTSAVADIGTKITKSTVTSLLTAQNFDMPAGNLTEGGDDFVIRTGNKVESYEELCNLPLMKVPTIGVIRLSDIAEITRLDNSSQMYVRVNGENGVMLSVSKEPQYSTADVSNILYGKMEDLEDTYSGISFTVLSDQGKYVNIMVDTIIQNLIIGGLLAIFVLLLFLKSIKPTFIVGMSIVISVIASFVLMYFSGISLNVISMCGLALSVGMLVDNSIVVVENIFRLKAEGVPVKQAAIDGAKQMAGAVIASTITTVVVFVPIIFTDGLTRQLFTDMALTIAFALLSSLIVALTLVPMASAGMLRNTVIKPNKTFDKLAGGYVKLLDKTLRHRWICVVLVVVLLAGSVWAAFASGAELFPQTDSGNISVSAELPADYTEAEKAAALDQLYDRIRDIEFVDTVGILSGNSSGGVMSLMGGDGTTCYVLLDEDRDVSTNHITQKIKAATEDLDFAVEVASSSMDTSMLTGGQIVVEIKGRELDDIRDTAQALGALLENIEGTAEIDNGLGDPTNELRIVVDKEKAAEYNLTVAQVYLAVSSRFSTATTAASIYEEGTEYEIYVYDDRDTSVKKADLTGIEIEAADGTTVKVADIASLEESTGFSSVRRENGSRVLKVTGTAAEGYNIGKINTKITEALKDFEPTGDCTVALRGENESINEAFGDLFLMLALAIVFIYLVMVAQFQSLLSPFIVMFTIPLAFTGGFIALFITGTPVSIVALIGLIVLVGVVVNNGIVYVTCVNQLREEELSVHDALLTAARMRIRPIIMTSLTTIIGLLFSALDTSAGASMLRPVAITVIGGMLYSTLLTLFFVPVIYSIFHRGKRVK